jgi:hypothetical protein
MEPAGHRNNDAMILKDFLPNPSLRAFVRCYRIVHMRFDSHDAPPFKPYTPRPEQCLAFYPHDREKVDFTDSSKTAAISTKTPITNPNTAPSPVGTISATP